MKKICSILVILLFYVSSSFADCIGVVTAGGGQHFWEDVKKGAIQAGKDLNISIYIRGAVDEANVQGQKYVIDKVIEQGCIGLVLAPNSKKRIKDIQQLKQKGIPTVYIDRDIGGDRISVIKTNNFSAGELAGKKMVQALKGKGKVAIFRLNKDVGTTTSREKGFIAAVTKGGLKIVIDKYLGTRVGKARIISQEILKNVSQIDGVFTPNESTSIAVLKTLEHLNKSEKIIHIGFDSRVIMINALKSNQMHGFVVQDPFQIGYKGVYTIYQALQGKPIKNKIDTQVVFVNKKNLNNMHIKKILGID